MDNEKWHITLGFLALIVGLFLSIFVMTLNKPITQVVNVTSIDSVYPQSCEFLGCPTQIVTKQIDEDALSELVKKSIQEQFGNLNLKYGVSYSQEKTNPSGACFTFKGVHYDHGKVLNEDEYKQCVCKNDYYCYKNMS